jgi:hypothetical protein
MGAASKKKEQDKKKKPFKALHRLTLLKKF